MPNHQASPRSAESSRLTGRLWIVLAAVMWSSNGLFVKAHLFDDWPQETRGLMMAFWRALFAGLCLLPAVRCPRWRPSLVPMTLCFTAMNVAFLQSMALTTAANASWLQNMAPLWVFLCGRWIWKEPLVRRDLITLAAGLLGAGTILYFELNSITATRLSTLGVLFGVVSGIFYAVVVMSMRHLRAENGAWLIALNHLAAAAILAPYCLTHGPWPSGWQWPVLCAFGLFQMALPYLLFARGLRLVTGQEGVGITLLEPVLVPLWVMLAWEEQPAWWTMVGGGLILLGLTVRYLRPGGTRALAADPAVENV